MATRRFDSGDLAAGVLAKKLSAACSDWWRPPLGIDERGFGPQKTKEQVMTATKNRLQLRKICRSLLALTLAGAFGSSTFANVDYSKNFQILYDERRFDEAATTLEQHLDASPDDYGARTKLALTLLRMGERDFAHQQIERLRAAGDAEASRSADSLQSLLDRFIRHDADRDKLSDALGRLDAGEARHLIDGMDLVEEQKAILRMYVATYSADYSGARAFLAEIHPQRLADHKRVKALAAEIDAAEQRNAELMRTVDSYWYGPVAASTFGQGFGDKAPEIKEFSVVKYLDAVEALAQNAPLSATSMDATFHASLIASPKDEAFKLGQRILQLKGQIRVPCLSRSQHFDLVIDAKAGRLRTDIVNVPFKAAFTRKGTDQATNDWYGELVPFDVPFAQLDQFEQRAPHNYTIQGLDNEAYVLKLKHGGVVPAYALMSAVHMIYGEKAQKTATAALGEFLVKLADTAGANVKAKLVDPAKMTPNGKAIFMAVMGGLSAGVGSYASTHGDFSSAAQLQRQSAFFVTQAASMASKDASVRAANASWTRALAQRGFDFASDTEFGEVETLLGLQ